MKKILLSMVIGVLLLVCGVAIAGIVFLDHRTWTASRRLFAALQGARQVTLVEYVDDFEIARKVASPEEISRLRGAITTWPRPFFSGGDLCFLPHHRIEIVRADRSQFTSLICFDCQYFAEDGQTEVILPPYLAKSLTVFFTSVGMAPKSYDEYTKISVAAHKPDKDSDAKSE